MCKQHIINNPEVLQDIRINGLQIVQPPFESATYDMVVKALKYVNLDKYEIVTLANGEKKECGVGFMYVLRLEHEPSHKIFARSVGVYGKHEQAPSGTDAHRFGEMESWALFAYEAWGVLKEFHSVKADNPEERYRFFKHLFDQREEIYEPISLNTVTLETFKTYLKGCGLKVNF